MTDDEAVRRLAACKDIAEILDRKPATQLTYAQLDDLEGLQEVFATDLPSNTEIREKAEITPHQVEVLSNNVNDVDQVRKIKKFNGDRD